MTCCKGAQSKSAYNIDIRTAQHIQISREVHNVIRLAYEMYMNSNDWIKLWVSVIKRSQDTRTARNITHNSTYTHTCIKE